MGMGQNLVHLVNIKIAGKWMFIPLKMVLIGIDPYPYWNIETSLLSEDARGSSILFRNQASSHSSHVNLDKYNHGVSCCFLWIIKKSP